MIDAQGNRTTVVPYTASGLDLTLNLGSGNAYTLNTGSGVVIGDLAAGDPITWVEFFNQNAGPDTPYNLYIGSLTHQILGSTTESFSQSLSLTRAAGQTDGIDDTWWGLYGITGSDRVAADDPDGDGFTNAQEYALGTDPKNAGSTFKVGEMTRSGTNLTISWPSVAGKRYQVQTATQLGANSWQNAGEVVTPSGRWLPPVFQEPVR
ncbi:MAG: hypothetical protein EBZ53_06480 [Verrucomicrobia bacterium]|nr:hypothetical protein [Verrucomicrobiota bacterium]